MKKELKYSCFKNSSKVYIYQNEILTQKMFYF